MIAALTERFLVRFRLLQANVPGTLPHSARRSDSLDEAQHLS